MGTLAGITVLFPRELCTEPWTPNVPTFGRHHFSGARGFVTSWPADSKSELCAVWVDEKLFPNWYTGITRSAFTSGADHWAEQGNIHRLIDPAAEPTGYEPESSRPAPRCWRFSSRRFPGGWWSASPNSARNRKSGRPSRLLWWKLSFREVHCAERDQFEWTWLKRCPCSSVRPFFL